MKFKKTTRGIALAMAVIMTTAAAPMAMATDSELTRKNNDSSCSVQYNGGVGIDAAIGHLPTHVSEKVPVSSTIYSFSGDEKYAAFYSDCECNAKGQIVQQTFYDPEYGTEAVYWCQYFYDANGYLIKTVECDLTYSSPDYTTTEYTRDSHGNIITEKITASDGEEYTSEYENVYDANGLLTKAIVDDFLTYTYTYDDNDRLVKATFGYDGETYPMFECTYDNEGNETSHTEYWDGEIPFVTEYEYQNLDDITPTTLPVTDVFTDVPADTWYVPFVQYAYDTGLMSGISDIQFAPNTTLTRAEMAQILYNRAGKPTITGTSAFTDVKEGTWYNDAILWAVQNNIVSGVGNGKFAPEEKVTREQLAVMLYNCENKLPVSGSLNGFEDDTAVSNWAKDAMLWATQNGIISGSKNGDKLYLNPTKNASRAETATMMMQYLEK